ncbi:MAG: phosphatase PAP2 family protein [Planctomycetota bacterium]
MASDYNRGLWLPVRWAHVAAAAVDVVIGPVRRWTLARERREWAVPMVIGGLLVLALLPLDGVLYRAMTAGSIGGDVRRELESLGQYGQLSWSVLGAAVIWAMDPAKRRRLLDWLLALALVAVVSYASKVLFGRVRPRLLDDGLTSHLTFVGPVGGHPMGVGEGVVSPWQIGADGVSNLWAMPSSHTSHAVLMSVFVATMYPRLRTIAVVMAVIVGLSRVVTGAHWPTDVVLGVAVGLACSLRPIRRGWGVRLLDWIWVRAVDRDAEPAWPGIDPERAEAEAGEAGEGDGQEIGERPA